MTKRINAQENATIRTSFTAAVDIIQKTTISLGYIEALHFQLKIGIATFLHTNKHSRNYKNQCRSHFESQVFHMQVIKGINLTKTSILHQPDD